MVSEARDDQADDLRTKPSTRLSSRLLSTLASFRRAERSAEIIPHELLGIWPRPDLYIGYVFSHILQRSKWKLNRLSGQQHRKQRKGLNPAFSIAQLRKIGKTHAFSRR